ncbi:MAG: CBS domain-containing protein [Peptococcaceae bacterium]|nr:CBS domain-containing protein [Peptococcaceae bacterium]
MMFVKEKRVKDIMTPIEEYSSVSANNTVGEAISILKKSFCPDPDAPCNGHRSVLVYDNDKLVGLVTFRALLTAIEPRFIKVDQWAVPVFWEGLFTERCREEARKKVREIMVPIKLITLDAEDTIIKAVHAMIKHKLGSLPVVKDGAVVGMVRISEIFHEISNLVTEQPEFRETATVPKGALSF